MSWIETTLGERFELYQPKTITTKDLKDDGKYLVYGANGVIGKYDQYNHEEPQLLVTCRGATCGAVNVSKPFSWINGNAMVVKPLNKDIDVRFIEYFFRGAVDLSRAITGAAQPQITRQSLSPIVFKYPPISTQLKIVAKLDAIFAEIDKATAAAEANAKNAEALFQSYLNEVFESGYKGWEIKYLSQISENLDSKRIPITKGVREEGSVPYYGASGIVDYVKEYIFDGDILLISEDGANLLARTYPIAFSVSGKCWVNNHAHVLRFPNLITQKFVEFYLNSISLRPYVSGMAQPKLNQAMLNKIPIPCPSLEEQSKLSSRFVEIKCSSDISKKTYIAKAEQFSKLKQSVLRRAFSGDSVKA